jgi:Zn-dependent protease/CBS domain-containing protein
VSQARPKRNDFRLGSFLGFEVRVDLSWFIIFFLVFWSLASGVFPSEYPGLPRRTHLLMGLAGTLLFFVSLLVHELSHALVSRRKGIPVEGITLFVFGGMARAKREPDSPRDEILIAGIGPVTSCLLAGLFRLASMVAEQAALGDAYVGVARYLAFINLALAVFNVMPGFPLDGGRVFRAVAWSVTGSRTKATRMATAGGRMFGLLLIVLGAAQVLGGAPVSGLWLVFIGWFLRTLAGASLSQHVLQDLLGGFVAADVMARNPSVVDARVPVEDLIHGHFMRMRYGSYPVMEGDAPVGLVTLDDIKSISRDAWPESTAADAMTPLADCAVVPPTATLAEVMEEMSRRGGRRRALVIDGGRLVGVVSATDLAHWIERVQGLDELLSSE